MDLKAVHTHLSDAVASITKATQELQKLEHAASETSAHTTAQETTGAPVVHTAPAGASHAEETAAATTATEGAAAAE